MNYKEHTRLDLVAGGNVFKQGDHMTLGFTPRDYEGDVVDLTGKDIEGVIYSKRKGIMYTAPAEYITSEQKIEFTIDEVLDHGQFQVEFTATDAADPDYRRKFPSGEQDGKLIIKLSSENMDVVGVQMTTVSQLKNELQVLQNDFAGQVLPRVDTVEGRQAQLETQFTDVVSGVTDDAEILSARTGPDGTYQTIGQRMDATTTQLDQNTQKMDSITSVSEMVQFVTNKGSSNEDWQPAVQKAIDNAFLDGGGTVRLPRRTYQTYSTITVKPTVELVLDTGAIIKPMVDIDVMKLNKNGKIRGGKIDTGNITGFTKSCILLNGDEKFNTTNHETFYGFIELRGNSSSISGNGIRYFASGNAHNVCWVHATHVTISYFDKGVFLDCLSSGLGNQWVNGNQFDLIGISACKYPIYLNGSKGLPNETSGNTFANLQIQPSSVTERYFYISGLHNSFSGMLWDSHIITSPTKIELTSNSSNNVLNTNIEFDHNTKILDLGSNNIIGNANNSYITGNLPPSVATHTSFGGHQDDFLAFADKRYTITQSSGTPVTNGFSGMFNTKGSSHSNWDAAQTSTANPVVLEIDFGASVGYLGNVGISSGPWNEQPKNIKIEAYTGTSWTVMCDSKNNTKQHFMCNVQRSGVTKLRITFSESYDPNGKIRIYKLFAYSATHGGQTWLPRDGGKVYGDIEFDVAKGAILTSPNGTRYRVTVSDAGTLSANAI